jgi:hypothetical protein
MPALSDTLWPGRDEAEVPVRLLLSCAGAAALGAAVVGTEHPGSGIALVGVVVLVLALAAPRTRPSTTQLLAAAGAVALLGVSAVRAAEWLDVLCLLGAVGLGSVAVLQGRSWTGVTLGALAPFAVCSELPVWVRRGLPETSPVAVRPRAVGVVGLTSLLVLVFGALFSAADPAYAALVGGVVPDTDFPGLVNRVAVLGVVFLAALTATALGLFPAQVDALAPQPARPVRRVEWLAPLVAVDVVFVSFVLVQLAVLFGGHRHVLETRGLSYAEYARHGFWELLVVTLLTLAVVAAAVRWAPRETPRDRLLLRVLVGVLCTTTLVVVASAVHRMSLYEQAFGYTRLRLVVEVTELALGGVLLLVLLAGVRLTGSWLPRSVVALAALSLLGLAVLNPDGYVASRNVDRFAKTGQLDPSYLAGLSADAVPALLRLPVRQRSCLLEVHAARLELVTDHWYDGNLARRHARSLLRDQAGKC